MAGKCSQPSCFPEDTGCNIEGCDKLTDCRYYNKGEASETEKAEINEDELMLHVPWTGNSMGLEDLKFLTASSTTIIVGITGVANAGKTTFLALLYCLLRNGQKIGDYTFCGSKTISGWENLAWYLSWKRENDIQFPPHTSSNSGRVPGLLHLAVRNTTGLKKNLIFTDAPGEWFDNWSYNKNDANAEGANWIHEHADAFLLFADCDLLSGAEQGKSRRQIKLVADRLSENLYDRPLGLVWSKSDVNLDPDMKSQISSYLLKLNNCNYGEFQVSVKEGPDASFHLNVCKSIEWILAVLGTNKNPEVVVSVYANDDLFISKRPYHESK